MNEQGEMRPMITLDGRKNRVRIHKHTLHLIGDPAYVQFLINPQKMLIAILGSDHPIKGGSANRVNSQNFDADACVECYSMVLMVKLAEIIKDYDPTSSYRLIGEANPKERIAQFSLNTMQRIES
jgi:hypothetical protein